MTLDVHDQARSQEFAAGGKVDSWGATISVNGVKFLTTFFCSFLLFVSQSVSSNRSSLPLHVVFAAAPSRPLPSPPLPSHSPKSSWGGQTWTAGGQSPPCPPWLRACARFIKAQLHCVRATHVRRTCNGRLMHKDTGFLH
jgi:hypothetical protein